MKSQNNGLADLLDFDTQDASQDILWSVGMPQTVDTRDGFAAVELDFFAQTFNKEGIEPDKNMPSRRHMLWVRAYGEEIIRLTINFNSHEMPADENNPMLEIAKQLKRLPLSVEKSSEGWKLLDRSGKTRMEINTQSPVIKHWSDLIPAPPEAFNATIYP